MPNNKHTDESADIVTKWLANNDTAIAHAVNDLLIEYQGKADYAEGRLRNDCQCEC